MSDIVSMCAKHAAHEGAIYDPAHKLERLSKAIFGDVKLICLVACSLEKVVGYATCIPQYSTWLAGEYLYLDCLYVEADWRGKGVGQELMKSVAAEARRLGCFEVQWQTPDFNHEAIRFYDAMDGTFRLGKCRYTWHV